jgi:hypothetical protein
MRFITLVDGNPSLTEDFINNAPPYAILSHTWGSTDQEVTYRDALDGFNQEKHGYQKIMFCARQAQLDSLDYLWVDTCCINTANVLELPEAINCMFYAYQNAARCYVYLSDVFLPEDFQSSRWFTRSWTLQELLAPASVQLFTAEGILLGDKKSLEQEIHEITGIPLGALRGEPLSHFSIDERFSWAAKRQSTRPEDWAYSFLGIFNVFLPLIYGEGRENAIRRLRKEIGSWEAPEDQGQLLPRYRELGEGMFRIVIINPGVVGSKITGYMVEHACHDAPEYHALSYTWGNEPPIHRIDINYEPCYVPPNLFHALQRLRSHIHTVFLWVDLLCINQSNEAEKSTQVRRMSDIYQKAKNVWIWLGEEDWKSKLALEFIPQVNHESFLWDGPWWKKDHFTAFNHILERPWFRRRWVIQEAAYSVNSVIFCGDCRVNMNDFVCAVRLVRQKLHNTQLFLDKEDGYSYNFLTNFRDSPATRVLDIIWAAFHRSDEGEVLRSRRRLSLETLVDLSSFCETKNPVDAVFALLNLANDVKQPANPHSTDSIVPDYTRNLLDVFADFILHCCQSGSLDIICRPWVPLLSSGTYTAEEFNRFKEVRMCSWLIPRDDFPFSNLSAGMAYQQRGKPLVGSSLKRVYNAHCGTMPQVCFGRAEATNYCDGSLYAKGIVLGVVNRRSTRMASGIITKECLDMLQTHSSQQTSGLANLPDTIWRTLCADRDVRGDQVSTEYQSRIIEMIQLSQDKIPEGVSQHLLKSVSSIDVEEILEMELPKEVKEVALVVRDTIWNRRTFSGKPYRGDESLVGLVPQQAKVGDQLCIIYGCSVPVVLRKEWTGNEQYHWHFVGEAYVHGYMDGKGISSLTPTTIRHAETGFKMR